MIIASFLSVGGLIPYLPFPDASFPSHEAILCAPILAVVDSYHVGGIVLHHGHLPDCLVLRDEENGRTTVYEFFGHGEHRKSRQQQYRVE